MDVSPARIVETDAPVYYLYGDDRDAVVELAERLLLAGGEGIVRLRVDCSELERVQAEMRNGGLFGSGACHALVRNAEQATPAQGNRLLALARETASPHRLIICGAGVAWKKALHKRLLGERQIACCQCRPPDLAGFRQWLAAQAKAAGVSLTAEALQHAAESLHGMRLAARQFLERAALYSGDEEREALGLEVVGALLGEKAPEELEAWCAAVAARRPGAVGLARRLARDQGVAPLQMLSWLGTRMQQLMLVRWHQARGERDPVRAAGVFGAARRTIAREAAAWRGGEIVRALAAIAEAERQLKGTSLWDGETVIERLTLMLVRRE